MVAALYIAAFVFNLPRFWEARVVYDAAKDRYIGLRTAAGINWWFVIFYQTVLYYIIILIVPTVLLLYITYHLVVSLRKAKKARKHMTGSVDSHDLDLTLTLITVVIVFVVCNCFNPTRRAVVGIYGDVAGKCPHFMYPFTALAPTVHIFNASINMTIYILLGRHFRRRLKALLCCGKSSTNSLSTVSN